MLILNLDWGFVSWLRTDYGKAVYEPMTLSGTRCVRLIIIPVSSKNFHDIFECLILLVLILKLNTRTLISRYDEDSHNASVTG